MGSLEAALEVGGANIAASHGSLHVLFEESSVTLELVCCFLVQWVFWVWFL